MCGGEPLLVPYYFLGLFFHHPIPYHFLSFYHFMCCIIERLVCLKWEKKVVLV